MRPIILTVLWNLKDFSQLQAVTCTVSAVISDTVQDTDLVTTEHY